MNDHNEQPVKIGLPPQITATSDALMHTTAGYYDERLQRKATSEVQPNRHQPVMDITTTPKILDQRSFSDYLSSSAAQPVSIEAQATLEPEEIKKTKRSRFLKLPRLNLIQVLALAIVFSGAYLTYVSLATNSHIDVQVRALEVKTGEQNNSNGTTTDGGAPAETPPPSRDSVYSYTRPANLPKRLEVDSLDIVARIIDVGIDKKGNVDVPISLHDVGWFTGSTNPKTSPGSSVMVGHVGGTKYAGVFANLKKIKNGDMVTVVMGDESTIKYKVTDVASVPVGSIKMSDYLSYAGQKKDTLHLITCTGTFDNSSLTYDNRLVVTAEKE